MFHEPAASGTCFGKFYKTLFHRKLQLWIHNITVGKTLES